MKDPDDLQAGTPGARGDDGAHAVRTTTRGQLSFSTLLALSLGTLMLLAVGSVSLMSFIGAASNTYALLEDKASLTLALLEQRLRLRLDPVSAQANAIGAMIETGVLDPGDGRILASTLQATLAAAPQAESISFVRAQDRAIIRVDRDGSAATWQQASDRPEIAALAQEGKADGWAAPIWSGGAGQAFLPFVRPVRGDGRLLGVLITEIHTRDLSDDIGRISARGQTAFILYGRDRVLARSGVAERGIAGSADDPLPSLSTSGDPILARIWDRDRLSRLGEDGLGDQAHSVTFDDGDWLYLYRQISDYGEVPWIVGAAMPERTVDREVDRLSWIGWSATVLVLVAVGLAVLAGRRIARPVLNIVRVAEGVQRLDLGYTPNMPRSRVRELDEAGRALNSMVNALRWFELYLPKRLVHRLLIEGQAGMDVAHEREITVLFTDICGFSRLAHRLSPTDTADFLNEHFGIVGSCIEAEGGTIDKYIGDSVMAFWGAPDDQDDHAERALRAAGAIAAALRQDNVRRMDKGLDEVRIRIGIATGLALVGNIGAPGRINYTVVGDVVNLAQRIEQLGKDIESEGDVVALIADQTHARLRHEPPAVMVGRRRVRNRDEDIAVYRLI